MSHAIKLQRWGRWLGAGVLVGLAGGAGAQSTGQALPDAWVLGFERLRLPGDERLGLLGVQYLLEPVPGWRVGPAAYGAATGQRGGLFTWGGELQHVVRLGEHWQWTAGLYAGGGGGAGAPVGGGLMLRPHVDLWWRATPQGRVGLSYSEVKFPSGEIGSRQLGLLWSVEDHFRYADARRAGQTESWSGLTGVGLDRVLAVVGVYHWTAGASGHMGHVGVRMDRRLAPWEGSTLRPFYGLEVAGAAQGGADGYAEGLATVGVEVPVVGRATLGARAAAGLGGGGSVPTRGGGIAKFALQATMPLGGAWLLGGELGRMQALQGPLRADYAQLNLGFLVDQPGLRADAAPSPAHVTGMRWGMSVSHYGRAQRKDGSSRPMQAVGLRVDRMLDERWYLSGQAHSAVAGGAGAYSVGLVGLGAQWTLQGPWQAGGELLVGAAGGGGVAVKGGAIAQPMLWLAHASGSAGRWQVGAGLLKARQGGLSTPVLDCSWQWAFGSPERH